MGLNLRKTMIGLAALSVLAGVFALYLRFNSTPPIVAKEILPTPTPMPVTEVNAADPNRQGGKMPGGIKVKNVRQTELYHRNEINNRIDRKFGFEELLHERGNQWEITKPYMWIYLDRFVCRVTADRGQAQLTEAFGRLMPSDATFKGNVVIHVLPTDPNDPWECFIHLDDVGFLAEKSMFSSAGSVRFLSRAMRLTGVGMELIYDAPRSRLDLFRVFDLDSLRIRRSEVEAMAPKKKGDSSTGTQSGSSAKASSNETVSATTKTPSSADSITPPVDAYQCVFRRNVRLDSPDGVVVARDMLSINGIQWARRDKPDPKSKPADPNEDQAGLLPAPNALNTAASSYPIMSSIPDELYDIVVTCDGGADITLLGGSPNLANASPIRTPEGGPAGPASEAIESSDRQQVVAQRIDFDFLTTDTTMLGPVAMKFLIAPDPNSARGKLAQKPMPMTVAAQGAIRYRAAAKRIILEGGSTATLYRPEPNFVDEYRLAAPRLTLDLMVDPNSPDDMKVDLRRLVADGVSGNPADTLPVAVRMWRRVADKLLGWGALDARELQFDANPAQLTAVGPGIIWLHNAGTIRDKNDPNATVEPCYARLSNWDSLRYWSATNRIVAEDDLQQLVLDYFPLIDGKYGPQTQVVAGHVEATLQQDIVRNRMELVSFVASQGIEYDSEADHLNFVGSEMVYDQITSLLMIHGDDRQPCYLNGALVDAITVDLKTGKVETPIAGPSIFQIRR